MLENQEEKIRKNIKCAVLTISDSRTKQQDHNGKLIIDRLKKEGHEVTCYEIVPNEVEIIKASVKLLGKNNEVEAIILNGGTGISDRDVTIEAVQPLFTKEVPGFGELFRMICYEEDIDRVTMFSRATCGTINHRLVFITPGSTTSTRLAMDKLILPVIAKGVYELNKELY